MLTSVESISIIFTGKMAVKMGLLWFSFVLAITGSSASGQLAILHSPESLKFSGNSETPETLLKEIFSASLGLSVEENSEWSGLRVVDPFNTPEAIVEVYIDGVSSLDNIAEPSISKFPIQVDEYEPSTFAAVQHRIKQRFNQADNKLVNFDVSNEHDLEKYSHVFGKIPVPKIPKQTLQHLKYSVEEDYQFLRDLEVLKAIAEKVKSGAVKADNMVDFYTFRFRSLHSLSDLHGASSLQTKEAKKMLWKELREMSDAFDIAYDGSVVVAAVATDVAHTRTIRQAPALKAEEQGGHIEDAYSGDYAAIFNIILWFSVVLVFTMVAIVYAIMDMDPGRDSIIYRMTSTRMKKDN